MLEQIDLKRLDRSVRFFFKGKNPPNPTLAIGEDDPPIWSKNINNDLNSLSKPAFFHYDVQISPDANRVIFQTICDCP